MLTCAIAWLLLASCAADEPCFHEALQFHRAELTRCELGDRCVLPPESTTQCACFGPYNEAKQDLWDVIRSDSTCDESECGVFFCPTPTDVRCENGTCVGTY